MSSTAQDSQLFKKCPLCGFAWDRRESFLADPQLEMIGYQVCFEELTAGLFLFNHACEGTLAVMVEQFADLYSGPVFAARQTGTSECPGYCLHRDELARCPAQCECAFVRDVMQILRQWPKRDEAISTTACD